MDRCLNCSTPPAWRCLACREDVCLDHLDGHVCAHLVPDETDLYDPEGKDYDPEGGEGG